MTPFARRALVAMVAFAAFQCALACSGYKVTLGDKTMVGSNEDAWRVTPHIWFENAKADDLFGAAFTGSRYDGENGYAPQAGMNEMGLAFERLASYHPKLDTKPGRTPITNPTQYLKDILHSCRNVNEVRDYISRYDHSFFLEDVFLYVDRSGARLVVEPYTMTLGHEPSYVISNFCPSITPVEKANKLQRYRNGVDFLHGRIDTTLAFCKALSDTMHVCRNKIGDGTLLSSIWDLSAGTVNLFFYHDYRTTVQFNLATELQKGDHILAIDRLFTPNEEFEKLRRYKIPKNSLTIAVFLLASFGLFLFSSIYFLIQFLRRKPDAKFAYVQMLLFPLGLVLCHYIYVLSGSDNPFYFPAPYKDPGSLLVSLSSFVPFVLALVVPALSVVDFKVFRNQAWGAFPKALLTLNILHYIVLIGLFIYWGFYNIAG